MNQSCVEMNGVVELKALNAMKQPLKAVYSFKTIQRQQHYSNIESKRTRVITIEKQNKYN